MSASFYGNSGSDSAENQIEITTSGPTEEYSEIYTIIQGKKEVGSINIPKDLVIKSGEIVTDPENKKGTYIKFILANSEDVIYIDASLLVDIYKASAEATAIDLTIQNNEIKAEIKSASITKEMLKSDVLEDYALKTQLDEYAKENELEKYALKTELENYAKESELENYTLKTDLNNLVSTGEQNGTISFMNKDISITGLKSAAYTDSTEYDSAGSAQEAINNFKKEFDIKVEKGTLFINFPKS